MEGPQDYGDLPVQDFTHRLLETLLIIKWVSYFIVASIWIGIYLYVRQ